MAGVRHLLPETTSSSKRSGSVESFREEDAKVVETKAVEGKEDSTGSNALEGAVLFTGSSNRELAEKIAFSLGIPLGRLKLSRFADGEISLQFLDSLRGRDVYIVQPTSPPVNENLMELLLMISTCRRSSAKKITAVVPYYGYARQDRKLSSRVPISAADVARMIEAMGVDRVISVDLHCGQIQGFFGPRVPVDNLEAQKVGLQYFRNKKLENPVVVSPDAGGVYRARKFQEGFTALTGKKDTGLAMLIKQRKAANEIESMQLVGSVRNCDVVIVDDMVDTAGTLCEAAKMLRAEGARRIFAFATHGLFSGPALDRIGKSVLEEIVVSDSIKQPNAINNCSKIIQLSIGQLLADAIYHVHTKESLHNVFFDVSEHHHTH
ncbi:ribose-phosphate pyrophosphokinase [Gregarina niphandrodes]|uniref:ribose-phosphate diphosphokinase n=1 Tax=Gregarina niphandrodes TaxID=110365 RepID=A0A023B8Q1_GRENI|nr:ribose-phosphate pyrophosphokinase [Gregarina niphandrodes]EZG69599.1 ribose-phosphate pyrophosphokinase [Gregarina niphandrodes]|eukprot:XP_011129993.1 ribose-phosphate pyrophosphokinase [Gregarina niphandrodes]